MMPTPTPGHAYSGDRAGAADTQSRRTGRRRTSARGKTPHAMKLGFTPWRNGHCRDPPCPPRIGRRCRSKLNARAPLTWDVASGFTERDYVAPAFTDSG